MIKVVFPKVVSASRATDIPAWHADWFISRLREGYCEWQNPFDAARRQIARFDEIKAFVFWSKNPEPLIPHLPEIADAGAKFYFQFSLNNYESVGLEPGVPPLRDRLDAFAKLAKICPVVWRYDPIVAGSGLSVKFHLKNVASLMERLAPYTDKLAFSFVDLYKKTAQNFKIFNSLLRAPTAGEIEDFAIGVAELREKLAPRLRLATCAEPGVDFANLGIERNSCVDPELVNELCGELVYPPKLSLLGKIYPKDRGQREACGCAPAKDIGSYRHLPCRHKCVYCYAGHGKIAWRNRSNEI